MADKDLITGELERVYQLYGERIRHFRLGLHVLIISSVALFLLIVVPFLTFRDQVAAAREREAALMDDLHQARALVAATKRGVEQAAEIERAVSLFYERHVDIGLYEAMEQDAAEHDRALAALRAAYAGSGIDGMAAWVRGEAEKPPEEAIGSDRRLSGLANQACYWQSGIDHTSCRLCRRFSDGHRAWANQIKHLPGAPAAAAETATEGLSALVQRACGWLTRGEAHWERGLPLAAADAADLRGWLSLDLNAYLERFRDFEQEMRARLPEREQEVERIERARVMVSERLASLETQLERIAGFDRLSTPVGDLPIGLGQIVLLFPAILAGAFLLVVNAHARSVQMHRVFMRLCRKRDPTQQVMDAPHLAAIAPLWLDPRRALADRLAKWALLATPLLLTIANLVLVVRTEALSAQLPEDAAIPPIGYVLLYLVAVAVLVGSLRYIARQSRAPANDAASPQPDAVPTDDHES
jgi:hypothetical protein